MKITLIVDNPDSWIIPYVEKLKSILELKHAVRMVNKYPQIRKGDLAFFLSCEKIVKPEILRLHKHNLVVHESKLPKGRGWSPMTWQILAGKNKIPITLFEAAKTVDSGPIYLQDHLNFNGHELIDQIRQEQGEKTIELIVKFVNAYPNAGSRKQRGQPTYYPRRTLQDSQLDVNKTIKQQFNKLRVVDNRRYPAFFYHRGHKYILAITEIK